ncbi:MAG TPA: hypothetical protein VIV11_39560 [Kofleriaceae bacterium]
MLRLISLAAALVLSWAALDLRTLHAASARTIDLDGGVSRTARAVRAAIAKHELEGHVWLGKLAGVGGGRDTLIYVPRDVQPAQTIELVVNMEGHGSFTDAAMDHRHAASIARLRGNYVYVAPDAPSSAHGQRKARTPYWQRGCAERRCAGGHSAPGDFIVFLADVRARVAAIIGAKPEALAFRLSLIGFSNGGKGVGNALGQLAAAEREVGTKAVELADVVFADGNYGATALADAWRILEPRREKPRLTVLVSRGRFDGKDGNRRRAAEFWRTAAPDAAAPGPDRAVATTRLRLVPLRGGHHAIGDAAVDFLGGGEQPVAMGMP